MSVKSMVIEWIEAHASDKDTKVGPIGVALIRAALGTTGKGNAR